MHPRTLMHARTPTHTHTHAHTQSGGQLAGHVEYLCRKAHRHTGRVRQGRHEVKMKLLLNTLPDDLKSLFGAQLSHNQSTSGHMAERKWTSW